MVVVNTEFPENDEKKQKELVQKLIGDQKISDLSVEFWGKRQLAYEVKKQTEGIYLLATFHSEGVKVGMLEQQAKLNPQILRYLLTRKEENE
jgi:small subunit ribosomal protein S6